MPVGEKVHQTGWAKGCQSHSIVQAHRPHVLCVDASPSQCESGERRGDNGQGVAHLLGGYQACTGGGSMSSTLLSVLQDVSTANVVVGDEIKQRPRRVKIVAAELVLGETVEGLRRIVATPASDVEAPDLCVRGVGERAGTA